MPTMEKCLQRCLCICVQSFVSLHDLVFLSQNMLRYGDLFLTLLEKERMLCLGLYRCRNSLDQNGPRYVITAPASNFQLLKFDSLFVLCCGNQSCSEESIVLTQSDDEVQFGSIRTVNVKEKNHPLFGSNDDVTAV